MKEVSKKYIIKRNKIIDIIMQMNVVYEDDEIRVNTTPDFEQSKYAAEEILSCIGINKPNEIYENESSELSYY